MKKFDEEYTEYEINGMTHYGFTPHNFNVIAFEDLIKRLQEKTEKVHILLEIIENNSSDMARIIGINEQELSNQWNEIAETIAKIKNKVEDSSSSFISLLSSYKKKTLENEADWIENIKTSKNYLSTVNDKLNSI